MFSNRVANKSQVQVPVNATSKALHKSKQLQVGTASGPVIIGPLKQKLNDDILPTNIFYFNATIHTVLLYAERNRDMMLSPQMLDLESNEMLLGLYSYKTVDHTCVIHNILTEIKGGIFDSGYSRHMIGNKSFLTNFQEFDGGFVAFGGSPKGGKITKKGKIWTGKLDFEDVYFVKELKFNLFSVSQMCDKKNSVLFTETKCRILSPDFKLLDESQVLLKVPRHDNMYSFDLKNVVPSGEGKATQSLLFSWVFFLATKDETSGILKTFISGIENQINHKVKIIKCDNGTEFKNNDINQFCGMKGIKREFSVSKTPQQNGVAERKNRTLIKAARVMLADSLLPTTFWVEAVNTACYVLNMILVTKPHNKTPYELLHGKLPSISFIKPFGCPVTILNTLDPLGKFDGKADEGFLVGYSINSKAFRLVTAGNQTNRNADAVADDAGKKTNEKPANEGERNGQEKERGASNKEGYATSTNRVSTVSPFVSAAGQSFNNADDVPTDPLMPDLEDTADLLNISIFSGVYDDEDEGAEADLNNLETTMNSSPIPTTRIHKDHPKDQIIGDINSATQTRRMTKISEEHALKVWTLVDLPNGKRAIGSKWVFRNKKDKRGIIVRNKTRLLAQGYTQEEGIDYDEVFAPVARIEAIRLFLAYASFMGFIVYQMDVNSSFLYGTIEEEVKQKDDGIFISQDKYVADILKKFDFITMKTASTLIETNKALFKDKKAKDVDVHLYRSMIGSLMYLTASRPDIMFAVCACARDSPFDLEAFFDSDYDEASLDRKSTTRGCQFLGKRLISWQCKKQTIVANSTTEAEYVVVANCYRQVLWIQNQMLDYGFSFMNTKIHIDNESTIYIVKNLVFHAKTKHIEIRHHFIRDSYKKRLIQVIKIHTDYNVADLLTKAFDVNSISNEFRVKTGGCKVNAAMQDLVLLGESYYS
ncbi:putative ribonuclease H-like domain-containing protein [Tanacetum coccineum]